MLQLDRITGLHVERVTPTWTRDIASISVPGGASIDNADGAQGEHYSLRCAIREECAADALTKLLQLRELRANIRGYPFHYLYFTGQFADLSGWYALGGINLDLDGTDLSAFEFDLDVTLKYSAEERRLATHWQVADEEFTGWGALAALSAISLPNGADNVPIAIALTRTGADGSNQILEAPTRNTIHYELPETPAGWYRMETRILDTQNADSEIGWTKAYNTSHHFVGARVFQNGLLRYIVANNVGTWYVWDDVSANHGWIAIGEFRTELDGNLLAPITRVEIPPGYPTSEEIQWVEWRIYAENPIKLTYSLRRGMPFVRVEMKTYSLGTGLGTNVYLYGLNYFQELFNASDDGVSGGGDLAVDANYNYHAGFANGRNVIAGFVLCDMPGQQPYDGGVNKLCESEVWITGTTFVFFIYGYPCDIATFDYPTERANGARIASHCMHRVKQQLTLVGARQYA